MKKIICLTLVFVMLFALCACGETGSPIGGADNITTDSGFEIEVRSCAFDKEVMGVDEEFSTWGYTEREGKVYVNLALRVKNTGTAAFTEDSITASFEYDNSTYDMQYSLSSVLPKGNNDESIPAGCIGVVEMFALVDEAAVNSDITVKYTVDGKERSQKVAPIDTTPAFDKKTELKVGDKISLDGFYDIEVISCTEGEKMYPTGSKNGSYYTVGVDKKVIDVVVKIKNNTAFDFMGPNCYTINSKGEILRGDEMIESQDNTEITRDDLKAGEERYMHIYVAVEQNEPTQDIAVRYTIADHCFYTKLSK